MCARYDNLIDRDAYGGDFGVSRLPAWNFPPRYNVAPTDPIPVVRIDPRDGVRELALMRWGLVPSWMKEKPKAPHINARAETVATAPMFREAFARRRCLIPATGFYEWETRADGKQPWRFVMDDGAAFAFAGVWEYAKIGGEALLSATIVVCPANTLVAAVHDRMPVILPRENYDPWLDDATPLAQAKAMLAPYDPSLMRAYAVNRVVNSVRNDVAECIAAAAPG
jgi:putative SOS response-associated peptidase YedK